jgi:BirA family biotin operon repressor/biotin-[acetyl-CoA-carboxylase] ligase
VVLGIGINVNQTEFPDELPNPGSVALLRGPQDRAELLGRVIQAIESRCAEVGAPGAMLEAWRRRSVTLGKQVRVGEIEGWATDLRDDGALMLSTESGPRAILAGDVEMVRVG